MLVVLLPISAALVFGSAYLVVSMAPLRSRVGRWLALWLAVWAEVVLTVEILSLLDAVTPLGFVVCYLVGAAIAVGVWLLCGMPRVRLIGPLSEGRDDRRGGTRRRKPKARRKKKGKKGFWRPVFQALGEHPALGTLLVVLAICALVNLLLAVGLPVNNYDAHTYHLSRVGYWIQYGTTDHFFTHNERQNFMPPNAEFIMLSMIIFARAEWPAPLGQYAAYFVCLAAVYFIARQLETSNAAALFAALVLGTMTEVVLQATIPKNGLIVSSFFACALAFALVGLGGGDATRPGRTRALAWSGLAIGLAVATKATALLFMPGLAIAGVVIAAGCGRRPAWLVRLGTWAACCMVGIIVVGSFNFVRNKASYGSFTGPPQFGADTRIARPTARSLASNLARYGYHLCDFSGLLPQSMARGLSQARAKAAPAVFDGLGIAANAPDLNVPGATGAFPVDAETERFDGVPRLHEDRAWFGPIAFFVGVPLVLVNLVYSPVRGRWAWFAVALTPVMYWLVVSALLRYSAWSGRYFVTAIVAGAPLLALAYKPKALGAVRSAVTWLLVLVGASTVLTATFYNTPKPIVPKAPNDDIVAEKTDVPGVLTMRRVVLRCRYNGPKALPLCTLPEEVFPEEMTLGIVVGGDDYDWLLFGPHLRRTVVPLPCDSERIAKAFRSGEVDMVLISKAIGLDTMPPILGERPFMLPLQAVRTQVDLERMNHWSFVLRTEGDENVLFPARDWLADPERAWVGADQRFVPVRTLPKGHIALRVEPNANILAHTGLVFEFYAGATKIRSVLVVEPGTRPFVIPWAPGPEPADQILRVRVRTKRPEFDQELQRVADVYAVIELPEHTAASPARPDTGPAEGTTTMKAQE